MRSKILIFLTFSFQAIWAQNNFINVEQSVDVDLIKKFHIKKIYALENDTNCVLSKDCPVSAIEEFDKKGRLIIREQNWFYSTRPQEKRIFRYDSLDRIVRQKYYMGDSLVNIDYFDYDEQNRLIRWLVYFGHGERSISKEINYVGDRLVGESLFANDSLHLKDSLYMEQDRAGRVTKEVRYRGNHCDSLVYQYDKGDTVLTELRYIDRQLFSMVQSIKVKQQTLLRRVIVEDGRMMGVEKKFYAENGALVEQSLVHHFAEANYKKKYFYNAEGILTRKEIYRNSKEPEAIIYYKLEYF